MKPRLLSTARLFFPLAAAIAALVAAKSAHAAALTWDAGNTANGTTIDPLSGNWNLTAGNIVWNNAGTNVIWSQTSTTSPLNNAIFGGTDGTVDQYVVTLASQMAASALTFNSTGYKITSSTVDLQTSGSTNGSITVAAGKTTTINSALLGVNAGLGVSIGTGSTLNLGGGFSSAQYQFTGAGTLNITGGTSTSVQVPQFNNAIINQTGGTVNSTANAVSYIGHTAGRSVNYTISSAGTLNVNGSTGGGLIVGRNMLSNTATLTVQSGGAVNIGTTGFGLLEIAGVTADTNAKLDVQAGTLTVGTSAGTNRIILFNDGAAAGRTATMTQSGGTVTTQGIQFGNTATNAYDGSSSATLLLSGGNLYVGTLGITRSANAAALPVTIQLQGGTLGASGAWSSSLAMKLGTTGGGPTIRAQDSGTVARDITLTGILSNNGAVNGTLTKTGLGTLTLSNANTYTGATTINAGILNANSSAALGDGSATNTLIFNGGIGSTVTLQAGGTITSPSTRLVNVTNGGTVTIDTNGNDVSIAGIIGGYGVLNKDGTGTLTLTASNTFSANNVCNINGGTLLATTPASLPGYIYGYWQANINGTLAVRAADTPTNGEWTSGNIDTLLTANDGPFNSGFLGIEVIGSNTFTYANDIGRMGDFAPAGMVKLGAGMLTLTGTNTYTGATTITGGTLSVGASNNLGGATSNLVFNGGTLQITGTTLTDFSTIGHTVILNANKTVGLDIADPDNTFTVDQVLNQTTGGVTKLGAGTMVLSQVNTYTGATTINAGTLQIAGTGSLNSGSYNGAISIATGATFQYGSSSAQILSGPISGAGGLTKDTDTGSVLTLAGANTYTGETTIDSGTLKLDYSTHNNSKLSDSAELWLGGGTLDLSGGSHTEIVASTTLMEGTASHITSSVPGSVLQMGAITCEAGATIDFGATGIATTDTPNNAYGILGTWATTVDGFAVNSINADGGAITTGPTSDVARRNGGTQMIANNPTTNVRIIEGTGSAASITLAAATTRINTLAQTASGGSSDATIDSGGQTLRAHAILVATGAGALTIGNGTLAAATAGGDLALVNNTLNGFTIHSVIANNTSASTLTKTGVGVATLAGVNTYTGATTISDGTLSVGSTANLGAPAANLVFDGGTLQITGTALTNFSGIGHTVAFNFDRNLGLDIANATHTFTVDQVLDQGIGAFYKYGPGTVILNQVNTFTANFNNCSDVIEGTLLATRFASLPGVADDGWIVETGATLAVRAGGGGAWTSANLDTLLGDGGNTWAFATGSKLGIEVIGANTFTYTNDIAGTSYEPEISATKGLVKLGTGTLTLSGTNTNTGATTVTAGTLALVGGSQASPITVNNLASLGFTLGSGTTSTSTVSFSSGSTVKITGTPVPATSYTLMTASSFLGITPVLDTPITGFQLQVDGGNTLKLVPVASGYANWKVTNAPTGNPGDDYDGDGVSNAVEYLLGGTKDTNDLSKLPVIDASGANLVFTFKRTQASIDGTTTVAIQVGTTLASWPDSYTVPELALANNPGVTVQKDIPAGFDTVTLTVPRAPDGKKFARLVVTPAP